jgi:hypothetical protein
VKLFTALTSFLHRPQPPTPAAPAQFDDGLAEIARLIAREVPAGDAEASSTAPTANPPPRRTAIALMGLQAALPPEDATYPIPIPCDFGRGQNRAK